MHINQAFEQVIIQNVSARSQIDIHVQVLESIEYDQASLEQSC